MNNDKSYVVANELYGRVMKVVLDWEVEFPNQTKIDYVSALVATGKKIMEKGFCELKGEMEMIQIEKIFNSKL